MTSGTSTHDGRESRKHSGRALDRGSFRHVDDDLKLRLVVERQHLQDDELKDREQHRDDDGAGGAEIESMAVRLRASAPARNGVISRTKRRCNFPSVVRFGFRIVLSRRQRACGTSRA